MLYKLDKTNNFTAHDKIIEAGEGQQKTSKDKKKNDEDMKKYANSSKKERKFEYSKPSRAESRYNRLL